MEVDQAEGDDNPDNLCLACDPCNAAKSNFQAGIDPQTDTETPLFNPRTHDWVEHFSWSGDFTEIIGLTPMGRATIERLNLNPEKRQIMRQLWIKLDLHPPGQ